MPVSTAKRGVDRPSPSRPDTLYSLELLDGCGRHSADGSEAMKERSGGHCRDSWDRSERSLARVSMSLRTLAVRRSVTYREAPAPPGGELFEPERGVPGAFRPDDRNAEICDCKQGPSDGCWAQRAIVDVATLHQEHRPAGLPAKSPDLLPEATVDDGQMQVTGRLALDERLAADDVVRDLELLKRDGCAQSGKTTGHAAESLMDVDHQLDGQRCPHLERIARRGVQH